MIYQMSIISAGSISLDSTYNFTRKPELMSAILFAKKHAVEYFVGPFLIFFILLINIKCSHVVLTVTFHAHCQALLETTVLAPVPVILVNLTVARATALVAHLLPAPDKNRVRLHTVDTMFHWCTVFKKRKI
jgi:hypothetical protein